MPLIDPKRSLNAVQKLLIEDDEILAAMQLSSAPVLDKAKGIIKRRIFENELAEGKSRICIYFRPSRRTRNEIGVQEVLQIDCHVPVSRDMTAHDIIMRINKLLNRQVVGGRKFYYEGELGDLPTAPGYYSSGIRFTFSATNINP